jgi:predicted alpha/beta-hydrolase family hydrolase
MSSNTQSVSIAVSDSISVTGLLQRPARPRACMVLAHGAGAGMTHPFMAAAATELAGREIASLRYQFPYMEEGRRRPDPPRLAHAAVRAAAAAAARHFPQIPLIAGGKSYGGRMTSQAQAEDPLPGVIGLAFLGFPLHPAGKPSQDRGKHLSDVHVPMLFLQGTRDALAIPDRIEPLCKVLGPRATLRFFADADHSFREPQRSGHTDHEVMTEMINTLAEWIDDLVQRVA